MPASRTLAKRLASQLANVDEADFRRALDGLRGPAATDSSARPSADPVPAPAAAKPPTAKPPTAKGPTAKGPTVR